jgi:pimeloyl-ACP methyl ester carboxylesterase
MWEPQIERLGDHHCLVPDLPEHGGSADERPFTIAGSAAQVAELIRTRAHGGRAHVVGLSLGAQVAVALLGVAPELVDHAVVSSALVRPIPGGSLVTPRLSALSYRVLVAPLKRSEWWIRLNMKHAAGVPPAYWQDFRRTFEELTESAFANVMVENQRFRLPAGLDRVEAPTLVVVGRREQAAMHQSARDIAAAIPRAQARQVMHARGMSRAEEHNWNMTAPDLFTETVRVWIADANKDLPAPLVPLDPA